MGMPYMGMGMGMGMGMMPPASPQVGMPFSPTDGRGSPAAMSPRVQAIQAQIDVLEATLRQMTGEESNRVTRYGNPVSDDSLGTERPVKTQEMEQSGNVPEATETSPVESPGLRARNDAAARRAAAAELRVRSMRSRTESGINEDEER